MTPYVKYKGKTVATGWRAIALICTPLWVMAALFLIAFIIWS